MSFESMENNKRMEDLRKEIQKQRDLRKKAESERDEARAEMAHKVEEYRLITNAAVAEKARADAAEIREAALRAALVECVAALRSAPATVRYGAWAEGTRANAIAHGDAALAAPDPAAWVRREELEAAIDRHQVAHARAEVAEREMRRVAEEAYRAGRSAGNERGTSVSHEQRMTADLTALLEGTR